MTGEQIFYVAVAGIIAVALVCIVPIIGQFLTLARQREQHAALKQQMIEKGFSPDDICRVIEAGASEEVIVKSPGRTS